MLGETYTVKRVHGLIAREQIEGYVDPHLFVIGIDASLKGRILERVWLHELAHVFAMESGLHEFLSEQAPEMFCQGFSGVVSKL